MNERKNERKQPSQLDQILAALENGDCEQYAEERLYDKDGSGGAQFSLRANFGWDDKPKQESAGTVNIIYDVPRE